MKLCDVGAVNPEVVLLPDPRTKIVALHRLGANFELHVRENLFRHFEILERILPALFVRTLGRATLARQSATLFELNVFSDKLLALSFGFVISVCESLEKMRHVATGGKHAPND